jgi:hypothetical protein
MRDILVLLYVSRKLWIVQELVMHIMKATDIANGGKRKIFSILKCVVIRYMNNKTFVSAFKCAYLDQNYVHWFCVDSVIYDRYLLQNTELR